MKFKVLFTAICALVYSVTTLAAPVSFDFDFNFTDVSGSYSGDLLVGYNVYGSFVYDTDENNALVADTTPGTVPGHEYTSRYTFDGASYGADFSVPALSDGFTNLGEVEVLVNNDLTLTAAQTGGFLPDGTYDWIEILSSTAVDVCPSGSTCPPYTPGSNPGEDEAQEWTLGIFGTSDWFTDGSVIPDTLPEGYQVLLVGINFNDNGDEIGTAFASASAVPLPAAAWLFLSGLSGLLVVVRRTAR